MLGIVCLFGASKIFKNVHRQYFVNYCLHMSLFHHTSDQGGHHLEL